MLIAVRRSIGPAIWPPRAFSIAVILVLADANDRCVCTAPLGDAALIDYLQQLQIDQVVGHGVTGLTPPQAHQPSTPPKTDSQNDALCARLPASTLGLMPDTGRQARRLPGRY
jgi:hypothetical protein